MDFTTEHLTCTVGAVPCSETTTTATAAKLRRTWTSCTWTSCTWTSCTWTSCTSTSCTWTSCTWTSCTSTSCTRSLAKRRVVDHRYAEFSPTWNFPSLRIKHPLTGSDTSIHHLSLSHSPANVTPATPPTSPTSW